MLRYRHGETNMFRLVDEETGETVSLYTYIQALKRSENFEDLGLFVPYNDAEYYKTLPIEMKYLNDVLSVVKILDTLGENKHFKVIDLNEDKETT